MSCFVIDFMKQIVISVYGSFLRKIIYIVHCILLLSSTNHKAMFIYRLVATQCTLLT
jgi:hypothetical protein